jgi:hypothetical protein
VGEGYRVKVIGYRVKVIGYRVKVIGYRVKVIGYRVQGVVIYSLFRGKEHSQHLHKQPQNPEIR